MPGSRRFARRRRFRIDAAWPNCRHARDCTTRSFAGTACGASPGFVAVRARRRTKAFAARLCTAETARCSQVRFLLEVIASQAILTIEAPDCDGDAASRRRADPPMSPIAVVLVILTGAAFPVLLWTIGRAVAAIGGHAPGSRGQPRQYLAGRLDGGRITALLNGGDEPLVDLATPATTANPASTGSLTRMC